MQALARFTLRVLGWSLEGRRPDTKRSILLAAPHTSNWDLPFMLAAAYAFGIRPSWLGKRELFRRPFGGFMRWLGGIPIDRSRSGNFVAEAVERFTQGEPLTMVIPPSGTRSRAPYWKSGFYHIARGASVPVVCSALDYRRRVATIGPALALSGDVGRDMDAIRSFYEGVSGKYPERTTPVRLVEEDREPTGKAAAGGA